MQDVLVDLLMRLRLRTRVFHRGHHCGEWRLELPPSGFALFHLVLHGRCVIELANQAEPIELSGGDMIMFIRVNQHVVRAYDGASPALEAGAAVMPASLLEGDATGLVCGHIEFDPHCGSTWLDALPDYVIVRAASHPARDWLKHLLALLCAEASAQPPGVETVIERLADILFIHVLRSFLTTTTEYHGALAGFADPSLRRVLKLIHNAPQHPWTVAALAEAAKLSRSAFVRRFTRLVGAPPLTYLTQQRMEYAHQQLCAGRSKVIEVALSCGYESEASFHKAFKRKYGVAPGAVKRRANTRRSAKHHSH